MSAVRRERQKATEGGEVAEITLTRTENVNKEKGPTSNNTRGSGDGEERQK